MNEQNSNDTSTKEEFAALEIIGIFIGVFGLAVIVAIFFTSTYHGKITNLISGLILVLCSGAALFQAYRIRLRKKRKTEKV